MVLFSLNIDPFFPGHDIFNMFIFNVFLSSIVVELKYWFVAEKGDDGVYVIFYYAKAYICLCAGI